ncbi:MAG: hypothetical protein VYB54_13470 [Pseudomonadota bacterium]|nr:hypothetical protein [Pseudomonadota bacterium]
MAAALDGTAVAQAMRHSRWLYAGVNTAHVLGIALLVGSILPLNLRLLGLHRTLRMMDLSRLLVPVAATGVALALSSGTLLFLARPGAYLDEPLFLVKMVLVLAGLLHALELRFVRGLDQAGQARLRVGACVSATLWLAALVAGRMIAYAGD